MHAAGLHSDVQHGEAIVALFEGPLGQRRRARMIETGGLWSCGLLGKDFVNREGLED